MNPRVRTHCGLNTTPWTARASLLSNPLLSTDRIQKIIIKSPPGIEPGSTGSRPVMLPLQIIGIKNLNIHHTPNTKHQTPNTKLEGNRGNRTPAKGFGILYSTIKLCSQIKSLPGIEPGSTG